MGFYKKVKAVAGNVFKIVAATRNQFTTRAGKYISGETVLLRHYSNHAVITNALYYVVNFYHSGILCYYPLRLIGERFVTVEAFP